MVVHIHQRSRRDTEDSGDGVSVNNTCMLIQVNPSLKEAQNTGSPVAPEVRSEREAKVRGRRGSHPTRALLGLVNVPCAQ